MVQAALVGVPGTGRGDRAQAELAADGLGVVHEDVGRDAVEVPVVAEVDVGADLPRAQLAVAADRADRVGQREGEGRRVELGAAAAEVLQVLRDRRLRQPLEPAAKENPRRSASRQGPRRRCMAASNGWLAMADGWQIGS